MRNNTTNSEAEPFQRFMEHMPLEGDPSLVVLKAHLLMEEQLWSVISARLRLHEDLLAKFKRQFQSSRDIALIAEALISEQDTSFHGAEWIWNAVEKMNSLRNRMAHDLEPVGVEGKMVDVADCVLQSHERTDPRTDFYVAAFQVCSALSSLRRPVDPSDYDNAI